MMKKVPRIGEVIDDWCPRCRLLLNHGVVGMVDDEVKKVRCLTCDHEHPYRHGKGKRRKKESEDIKSLFDQLLKTMPKPPAPPEPKGRKKTQRKVHR